MTRPSLTEVQEAKLAEARTTLECLTVTFRRSGALGLLCRAAYRYR